MNKFSLVILALLLCFTLPLLAQEKEMDKKEMPDMPAPPPPLDDDFMNWMIGEWKGFSESEMGKSDDWMKCEMGFGGQFMTIEYKSEGPMGAYTGGGAFTLNQEDGIEAVWLDSFRDISSGKGKRDGDVMTMHWDGKMGKGTRITEKVSDDKLNVTNKWEMSNGMVMESKSEFTRVKAMTEKN